MSVYRSGVMMPVCLLLVACGGGGGSSSGTPSAGAGGSTSFVAGPTATPAPVPTDAPEAAAALPMTLDVSTSWTEDAQRSFSNTALELPWTVEMGAWRDRAGTAQGNLPFASVAFVDQPTEQVVRWDVTDLVRQFGADFLIKRSGGTYAAFHAREASDPVTRPRLIISRPRGLQTYTPTADTSLNATTAKSQGALARLSSAGPMLLRFDLAADPSVSRATLELTATTEQFGNQTLDVFRPEVRPKPIDAAPVEIGGAADVVMHLSGTSWQTGAIGFRPATMTVNGDGSLTAKIPAGGDTGSPALYAIPTASRSSTMFARAVMKVHSDWTGSVGGKFPGLANTGMGSRRTVQCAWGGRLADGTCWSARTNRVGYVAGTPFADSHMALQPYIYRVNRVTVNGDTSASSRPVPKGRFFVLDQMVRLNSIAPDGTARADGEIAYWLNGELINRTTGIVWRTQAGADTLPSEYWLDVYEGGTGYSAPHDHSVTFNEVVISTKLLPFDPTVLARLNN